MPSCSPLSQQSSPPLVFRAGCGGAVAVGGNWEQVWPKVVAARRASAGSHPPAGGPLEGHRL
eukprot:scaffold22211_cov56-Phaeocystis_antarctica.AAC.3